MVREAKARFAADYSIRYSSTESGGCGTGTAFDADDEEALFTVGRPRAGSTSGSATTTPGPSPTARWARCGCAPPRRWPSTGPTPTAPRTRSSADWLRTGDLGYIDDRGCLRLAGRLKEMFIRGGYNVYPAEVESVLADHPQVAAVAIVPRPDAVMGELGVAVVVPPTPPTRPTSTRCAPSSSPSWRAYKLPEAVRIVDELPLTPMQKIDRRSLAAEEPRSDP